MTWHYFFPNFEECHLEETQKESENFATSAKSFVPFVYLLSIEGNLRGKSICNLFQCKNFEGQLVGKKKRNHFRRNECHFGTIPFIIGRIVSLADCSSATDILRGVNRYSSNLTLDGGMKGSQPLLSNAACIIFSESDLFFVEARRVEYSRVPWLSAQSQTHGAVSPIISPSKHSALPALSVSQG